MTAVDTLLTTDDQQAGLSLAYVQAVAARAGYTCGEPPGPDRDSVDLQIAAGGSMRPKLDLQCKATINLAKLKSKPDLFSFPLKIKNYNDLRVVTQTPRLLVVLSLPSDSATWLAVSTNELMLRSAAYWVSLKNEPDVENASTVNVHVPTKNLFDLVQLQSLMERSRHGSIS